jgi:hypothetical protein
MILGFQKQFVPFMLDGTKAHTIRGERKDGKRPKPGEMLHLWTGLRQKGAAFVLRAPCLRTEEVEICAGELGDSWDFRLNGTLLDHVERDLLAWRDGFRYESRIGENRFLAVGSFDLMMQFWDGRLPFRGWITYWDYSKAQFERTPANHGKRIGDVATRLADLFGTIDALGGL